MSSNGDSSCLLKISNSEYLIKFLNDCVDDWIGRKHADLDTYNSDVEWTKAEMQRARGFVQGLYKRAIFEDNFQPEIPELSARDLDEIKDCFTIRKDEIYQAVVKEKLLQSGQPLVENFDWKVKWIMGSSTLASMSTPLLQLDLQCYENTGGKSTINFEMGLEQLDMMIQELENAKSSLQ